jgi:hypothetical protein
MRAVQAEELFDRTIQSGEAFQGGAEILAMT